jgi:hypothetical protein
MLAMMARPCERAIAGWKPLSAELERSKRYRGWPRGPNKATRSVVPIAACVHATDGTDECPERATAFCDILGERQYLITPVSHYE